MSNMQILLLSIIVITSFLIIIKLLKMYKVNAKKEYARQLDILQMKVNVLEEIRIEPSTVIPMDVHANMIGGLEKKLDILMDDYNELKGEYDKTLSQKKSSEVRTGHLVEKMAPFLDEFPFSPDKCIPLFKPIDYLHFDENMISFIEIKSGKAQLSKKQRNIRDLIKAGNVEFKIVRVDENGISKSS